ncbi:LacI family DNA-binding transcriptional regulator [Granulosicoccus antarcticus]|uniref:HTH-type transcriptional regulator GntR n=1 Tax=Granulosicoccus antarcticus IMCC3135 TaxID=1192854 RepID=A0A2Z2NLB5_9GAMM|nr:LacI family DNA-binding transcriptional regulator [Granulosicoccus antarcticus]ASJ70771.1 HTH-type transcriptional regulator GntR [Granulosicoccus antarcticus IMCC3135]
MTSSFGTRKRNTTQADVAKHAGVSIMTVSRALSGSGNISPDTKERINNSMEELGYVYNTVAGSLRNQSSSMVAVVIPSVNDLVFGEILSGVNSVLRPKGYFTTIGESFFDPEEEFKVIKSMLAMQPAGIILTGGIHHKPELFDLLKKRSCPILQMWDTDNLNFDYHVGPSQREVGQIVADHLIEKKYEYIAYIGAELSIDGCADQRFQSFRSRLSEAGISIETEVDENLPRQPESGKILTERLLARSPHVNAIHYLNDPMALGGLSYLFDKGLSAPKDVAVVGFNGSTQKFSIRTRLTTVDVPKYEIGKVSGEKLLALLNDEGEGQFYRSELRLIVGDTS